MATPTNYSSQTLNNSVKLVGCSVFPGRKHILGQPDSFYSALIAVRLQKFGVRSTADILELTKILRSVENPMSTMVRFDGG